MRFLIYIFLLGLIISCNDNQQPVDSKKEQAKQDTVKAFILAMDSAQRNISLPGELLPNENVQIRAKVPGYSRKLNVDIGSKVSKGQVLAIIDAPERNSHLQELNEKVKSAH